MKHTPRLPALLAAAGLLAAGPVARAGIPQPAWILYGQALDEYGWPYIEDATVELHLGGRLFKSYPVQGSLAPGVNFIFPIPLDSGTGARYDAASGRQGEQFEMVITTDDGTRTLLPATQLPLIGRPGAILRLNVTAGTDSDQDGLPDEWEQWIIDHSTDPAIDTLAEVRSADDFDQDGVSNLDEYKAGTDPAWDLDYFYIEKIAREAGDRVSLTFLTVPGKTYHLFVAPPPNPAGTWSWQAASYARQPAGAFENQPIEGSGFFLTVFLARDANMQAFRLRVE